jgi:hypothetical protein
MKMSAYARSAAAVSLEETLPELIPGFNEKVEFFMKECDFQHVRFWFLLGEGNCD